ncbi:MAG: hypothetical protein H0U87_07190 [Acidobacteria bacterium]|jgi:hypothetical protein|nr:hypothetical protein [Acidobacteriota bacterium]
MYRRPKFLEVLLEIRQEMSREADYDVDLFAEMVRSDKFAKREDSHRLGEEKDTAAAGDKAKTEQ